MSIRIITDSTSDITKEEAKNLNITIVPLKLIFGNQELKEGVDITMDEFYEKLTNAEKLPTTSQPSPDDFLGHFNEVKEAGDSAIVLTLAGKLSGTLQSAEIAKEMCEYEDIHIIDTGVTITALRLLVEETVRLRDEGRSVTEIVSTIEKQKSKVVLLAMVDTLEYLHKGGRLSKSSAILGTLLRFKPIITLEDGAIKVIGKERGVNKGILSILEHIDERGSIDTNYPIYLGYTAEDSKTKLLKEKLEDKYKLSNLKAYPVGCVVGTHAGPGACVVTYFKK